MKWEDGDVPYEGIESILQRNLYDASVIYVKGEQKAKWLQRYVDRVEEINKKCPTLASLRSHQVQEILCNFHYKPFDTCAVKHVVLMDRWLRVNRPSLERSIEIFHSVKHLSFMEKEDIAYLPREFILCFAAESIDAAWNRLPVSYHYDDEFLIRIIIGLSEALSSLSLFP